MKKLFLSTLIFMGLAISGFAQDVKVIALINKASWCEVCQANGPRFEKEIMPMAMANKEIKLVSNDLSNATTKAASLKGLKKAGLASFAKANTDTGMLYFIDAKTKKLISEVSLAKTSEEIKKVYMAAITRG